MSSLFLAIITYTYTIDGQSALPEEGSDGKEEGCYIVIWEKLV